MLKKSKALNRMRAGETTNSFKFNFDGHRTVQMVGMMDLGCLWTDMARFALERQVLAAGRVPRGSYSDLIHPLKMDASAIMVPHIMSEDDVKQIVKMTKFHPIGRRPVDGGNADAAYYLEDFVEYTQFVNKSRFVIAQIEDPEAMKELDAICAAEGIEMIFFGPRDYSHALGIPGQIRHEQVNEARIKVADCVKLAGTTGSPELFTEYSKMGYDLINIGANIHAIKTYGENLLERMKTNIA